MHGELLKMHCTRSGQVFSIRGDITPEMDCACCGLAGTLRPHIVWFGELPLGMERISEALSRCTLFLSIGTSGNVYPAAGFVREARAAGARTVEFNLEPSITANAFAEHVHGPAGSTVPGWIRTLPGS